jgi:proteasome lid subunit RPN8/RPN11
MVALTDPIHIKPEHWEQMLDHVSRMDPEEACGLAAGKDRLTMRIYPVENALHSTVRFRMEPQEQVDAILEMEELGWEMLAIFHSHPAGPPAPSPTDVAEVAFPDAVNLIWSKSDGAWGCRGFLIQGNEVKEISIPRSDI